MIKSFKDLFAWQKSVDLAVAVYKLTSDYPKQEVFGLVSQLRRAVISVSSNISEGFGRNNRKEKDQFYAIAYGSLLEVESQLIISEKLGYIKDTSGLFSQIDECQKILSGLRKSNKEKGRDSQISNLESHV